MLFSVDPLLSVGKPGSGSVVGMACTMRFQRLYRLVTASVNSPVEAQQEGASPALLEPVTL